tara:strand:+ start:1327 stop:1692 length:366 start_codon:yes stop_codon:yes gene_type:complete
MKQVPKDKHVDVMIEMSHDDAWVRIPKRDRPTILELSDNVPDRITDVTTEGDVAVVHIPNGRVKILPDHKKIKPGYSARHGGVDLNKSILPGSHYPSWLLKQSRNERHAEMMNNTLGRRKK